MEPGWCHQWEGEGFCGLEGPEGHCRVWGLSWALITSGCKGVYIGKNSLRCVPFTVCLLDLRNFVKFLNGSKKKTGLRINSL